MEYKQLENTEMKFKNGKLKIIDVEYVEDMHNDNPYLIINVELLGVSIYKIRFELYRDTVFDINKVKSFIRNKIMWIIKYGDRYILPQDGIIR